MNVLKNKPFHFRKPVITMGNFDGVHLGHRRILEVLRRRAEEIGGESVVLTYYHHPFETLHKKPYPYLLTEKEAKEDMLLALGIDHVLFLHFDDTIADMSADEFLENILIKLLHPVEIFIGYDSHFGRNRRGDFKFLKEHESQYGYMTQHVPPVRCSGQIISSTLIRKCISDGIIEDANRYLGRDYSIKGSVVHGKGIGHKIGYPTINVLPSDSHKLIPRRGIYLSYIIDERKKRYFGLTNIGYSPTLKISDRQEIETFLLDFNSDLYEHKVELFFIQRIRDEEKYDSKEELQKAIANDVEFARKTLSMKQEEEQK